MAPKFLKKRWFRVLFTLLFVSVLSAVCFFWYWGKKVDQLEYRMLARFEETLGDITPEGIVRDFPPLTEDPAIAELDPLGPVLGFTFLYTSELHEQSKPVREELKELGINEFFKSLRKSESPGEVEIPSELEEWLDHHHDEIMSLLGKMERVYPVQHARDMSLGVQAPMPNYLGHLYVNKLFLLEALRTAERGDFELTARFFRTSLATNKSINDRPDILSQLIFIGLLDYQSAVLSAMGSYPNGTKKLFRDPGYRSDMAAGFRGDFSATYRGFKGLPPEDFLEETNDALPAPVRMLLIDTGFLRTWFRKDYARTNLMYLEILDEYLPQQGCMPEDELEILFLDFDDFLAHPMRIADVAYAENRYKSWEKEGRSLRYKQMAERYLDWRIWLQSLPALPQDQGSLNALMTGGDIGTGGMCGPEFFRFLALGNNTFRIELVPEGLFNQEKGHVAEAIEFELSPK